MSNARRSNAAASRPLTGGSTNASPPSWPSPRANPERRAPSFWASASPSWASGCVSFATKDSMPSVPCFTRATPANPLPDTEELRRHPEVDADRAHVHAGGRRRAEPLRVVGPVQHGVVVALELVGAELLRAQDA